MLPGPVFQVELTSIARRKRSYVLRAVYGALILFIIWCNQPAWSIGRPIGAELSIQETAQMASQIAFAFMLTQAITVLAISPALVAGVIADEKRRKTLDYLLASRLSGAEIVLGKLFARILLLFVFVTMGLPILTLLSLFGGVNPDDVIVFTAACASTSFFLAALSIAVSLHAKRPTDAVGQAYSLGFLWLFGPSIVRYVLPQCGYYGQMVYEYVRVINEWIGASSPWFNIMALLSGIWRGGSYYGTLFWMMGLQLVFGVVLAVYSVVRLRPIFKNDRSTRKARGLSRLLPRRRLIPRMSCGDDAMFWKECLVSRGSTSTRIFSMLLFFLVAAYTGYLVFEYGSPALAELWNDGYTSDPTGWSARDQFNVMTRMMGTVVFCTMILGVASAASSSVTSEREGDTWISLTATPLDANEIVRGKMLGAFWATRWLSALWLLLVITGLLLGAIHPVGVVASLIVVGVDFWFACALGLYFSMKCKSSMKALLATISTLLFLNGLYLILTIPFEGDSAARFIGVMPFIQVMALFSWRNLADWGKSWNASYSNGYSHLDYLSAALCSVFLYSVAALCLSYILWMNFDDMIDRPHSSRWSRRVYKKKEGVDLLDGMVAATPKAPSPPAESSVEL